MAKHAPNTAGSHKPSERLPAVWPWLLIPLVALALFFTLRSVRAGRDAPPDRSATPAQSLPDDGAATSVH